MSEQGVFAVHRGIFGHPVFADEDFTEREAWLWLISTAVWKSTKVRAGHKVVDLDRGQLAFSERFIAEKWGWSKTCVRRFLMRLEREKMIALKADHDATRITICNYERYAFDGTDKRTASGPQADHERTKEEESKKDNKKEVSKNRAREPSSDFEFEDFWELWPNKVGKPAALKAFVAARKRAELDAIVAGVLAYIRDKPPDRQWLNPATFLNQNRWEDQPAKVNRGTSSIKSGSLIDAIDRELAKTKLAEDAYLAAPEGAVLGLPDGSIQRS